MSIPVQDKECLWHAKKPGFLLTEILVALLIFVGLSTVAIHYQWHSARVYREAEQQAAAFALAANAVEEYVISGNVPQQEQCVDGVKLSWSYEPISVQPRASFLVAREDQRCRLLHVRAQWQCVCKDHELTLVAGDVHV